MKKENFEIVKNYVENYLEKGVANNIRAVEAYVAIYGNEPFFRGKNLDQAIFRWWQFNYQNAPMESPEAENKTILTQVGSDTSQNFEGVKIPYTKSEDMSPEKQSHQEDADSELKQLEDALEAEEDKKVRTTLKRKITILKKKLSEENS